MNQASKKQLAFAFAVWSAYNYAERRMAEEYHEPYQRMQEVMIAYVFMLSAKAFSSSETKGTEYSTEMMRYERDIKNKLQEEFRKLGKIEEKISKDIVSESVKNLSKEIDKVIDSVSKGFDIDFNRLSTNLWNRNDKNIEDAMRKISLHIRESHSVQSMTLELQKISGSSEYNAYRLARTENMRYLNERLLARYKEMGVKYVKEIVTVDERTSDECLGHVGLVHRIDDAPTLPRRPNCRCTLAPIPSEEEKFYD